MSRNLIAWAAIAAAIIALPALAQPAASTNTGALTTDRAGPGSGDARPLSSVPTSPVIGGNTDTTYRSPSASGAMTPGTRPNQYLGMQARIPHTSMLPGSVAGDAPGMGSSGARPR